MDLNYHNLPEQCSIKLVPILIFLFKIPILIFVFKKLLITITPIADILRE